MTMSVFLLLLFCLVPKVLANYDIVLSVKIYATCRGMGKNGTINEWHDSAKALVEAYDHAHDHVYGGGKLSNVVWLESSSSLLRAQQTVVSYEGEWSCSSCGSDDIMVDDGIGGTPSITELWQMEYEARIRQVPVFRNVNNCQVRMVSQQSHPQVGVRDV